MDYLLDLPGGENLSKTFCNWPVRIEQIGIRMEPVAAILLCGRLRGHADDCDPLPPLSDFI